MFGKIFIVMLILLGLYYTILIIHDLYMTKLMEDEKNSNADEVEIDISEEVAEFEPTEIVREEKKQNNTEDITEHIEDNPDSSDNDDSENERLYDQQSLLNEDTDVLLRSLGQIPDDIRQGIEESESKHRRRPVCDEGIEVSELVAQVENLAQKGQSDMGDIIFRCTEMV
jgi:hypothetical protein